MTIINRFYPPRVVDRHDDRLHGHGELIRFWAGFATVMGISWIKNRTQVVSAFLVFSLFLCQIYFSFSWFPGFSFFSRRYHCDFFQIQKTSLFNFQHSLNHYSQAAEQSDRSADTVAPILPRLTRELRMERNG